MSFDSGTASFQIFNIDTLVAPGDLVAQLAAHAAPPIETLGSEPISGWVSPRHLLDREITEDTCISASYVRADLMKAERKIPASLLKAYCKIEEIAEMQARGVPYLNRQTRSDIKKQVTEKLLPDMPPTLTAIPMVFDTAQSRIYAEALTEKQQDAFCVNFNKATHLSPAALTPESAAMRLKQVDFRDIPPQCFSPDTAVTVTANNIGMDFLTWLWFYWETSGGTLHIPRADSIPLGFMLEGPAIFYLEAEGAHETALRKGMPLMSREAKTVLEGGKKLRKINLVIARGDEVFSATVDGMDFGFRSLKFPKSEIPYEPHTAFQERMAGIQLFTDAFYGLYEIFLSQISDGPTWTNVLAEIKQWITHRKTFF